MVIQKPELLAAIAAEAEAEARVLAGEFVREAEADREAILAGLRFEQWLAEGCDELVRAAENGRKRRA